MRQRLVSHIRQILILINLGIIIVYLLVCLVPFINTGEQWIIALAGLGFPILLFSLACFVILWAFLKLKWWWISLIALLIGFQQIRAVFAFNLPQKFVMDKQPNTLRVMQWNLTSWDEGRKSETQDSYRSDMLQLVQDQNADVLCFEEFFESTDTAFYHSNILALTKMGFHYYYFVPSVNYTGDYDQGIAIFSKFPMLDTASFSFNTKNIGEHLLYADIKVAQNTFRIFCTHLQSVKFDPEEYYTLSRLKRARDPGFGETKTIVSKLKTGYEFRYEQAELVNKKVSESPYPSILCGDFNDVPSSSTYFKSRGNLQDAFLKKGSGIGRSFRFISPTLRIDYILPDKRFKVKQFQMYHVPYSDHYPLETDLQY
jgi:endonuclease/exonuclease/phosphatase family metal-dependent hydrolase